MLNGELEQDAPPVEGDERWGASIVARPDGRSADLLDGWTAEARGHIGECWPTGALGSCHVTLRQLDRWHASVDAAVLGEGQQALGDLAGAGPLRTRLVGIAVSTGGVLAMLEPDGDAWDRVRSIMRGRPRALLHATLVHFTMGIDDPRSLLAWAERAPGGVRIDLDRIALVRYDYDSALSRMMPHDLLAV
ncbi:hypothetical protein [Agrococcus beijingensis]|uniref:hypothetical protein n=1 Tax=Agrococcus beijingensis TaxID=3068634 RepID=UPI0027413250|nr:hypothetical protein [Agrococcus sp. REN33]